MTVPAATVVIPTRDRPDRLRHCLASLARSTVRPREVIVVDDGSVDADAVAAVADHHGARLLRGVGAGPATARNLGARAALGEVLCFTDDDCRPGPHWLAALTDCVAAGAVAVAGPTRNGRPADVWATASQIITNHLTDWSRRSGSTPFAPTSNVAVRAAVFAEVPFDERFPLAAGEDREWCERLAAHGHRLEWEPEAWVDHHQDLSARRFWAQQERYGRGARHLRSRGEARLQEPAFYTGLLRRGFAEGPRVGALVVAAQVATAVGIAREARDARRPAGGERS